MEGIVGNVDREPEPSGDRPGAPLFVPNPIRFLVALAFLVACLWHLQYDATHDSYENAKITVVLGFFVFAALGYDVTEWLRGGGGGK